VTRFDERDRFVFTIVAIAASIFLFACGGGEREGDGVTLAERVRARRQGHGMPATASVGEAPAPAAQAAPPAEPAQAAPGPTADASSLRQADVTPTVVMEPQPPPETEPVASQPARPAPILRDSSGARIFSNKDLEKYRRTKEDFGFRDGVVVVDVTKKPAAGADGGDEVSSKARMTEADRAAELSATQARIKQLLQEQDYLRKRMLPLENPFVARAAVSEDDKLAESGMDNAERLQRVRARIAEVEGELGQLQRRFAELQSIKPPDTRGEVTDGRTPDEE